MTRAVFFDVDFTLIYPGPTLQGRGYEDAPVVASRHELPELILGMETPPAGGGS